MERNPAYSGPLRGLLEGECLHALQIQFVGVDVYTIVRCSYSPLSANITFSRYIYICHIHTAPLSVGVILLGTGKKVPLVSLLR